MTWGPDWWQLEAKHTDQPRTDDENDEDNPWTSGRPNPERTEHRAAHDSDKDPQYDADRSTGQTKVPISAANASDVDPGDGTVAAGEQP